MSAITPFRVEIPQADLDDLHDRLDRVRWPDELPGVGWDLGIPLERVRELATYWREKFDWRAFTRLSAAFDTTARTLPTNNVQQLIERIDRLEEISNVTELVDLLAAN